MQLENFDLNVLEVLKEALNSDIESGPNILGMSDLPFCLRANIIKGIYDLQVFLNNKMLFGMFYESLIYQPAVLKQLLYHLHLRADIQDKLTIVDTKKQDFEEIIPGKKLRYTPDVYTNLYTIEIKTTNMYVADWVREIAVYHSAQLNAYLCKYKQENGFVHLLNQRAFTANIKQDEFYWDTLWKKYGYFLPLQPNLKLYKKTKERAIYIFNHIDNEDLTDVIGPEFIWECGKCEPEIKKHCPNPIIRKKLDYYQDCDICSTKIEKGKFALFRNEHVFCEECFHYVRELQPNEMP